MKFLIILFGLVSFSSSDFFMKDMASKMELPDLGNLFQMFGSDITCLLTEVMMSDSKDVLMVSFEGIFVFWSLQC